MAEQTPSLKLLKPTVGAPETRDIWGYSINDNFDKIDAYTGPLPSRISALEASASSVAWGNITGKPSTFPPTAHTHSTAEVAGLDAALAGKASAVHTHPMSAITGLDAALAGKANLAMISTLPPSGGADGDIWYQVPA